MTTAYLTALDTTPAPSAWESALALLHPSLRSAATKRARAAVLATTTIEAACAALDALIAELTA